MNGKQYSLPNGWAWTRVSEIGNTTSGGTPLRSKKEYYSGKIPWLKSGELEDNLITDTQEKITDSGLKNSNAKIFPQGTLLIALYGATVGKTGILAIPASTNQAVCAIFTEDSTIDKKYLWFYLRYKRKDLARQSFGGAQPNISQEIIRNLDVPLPPLLEQHRIVGRVEELLQELRTMKEALEKAFAFGKQFRQSVLAKALRGEFTERDPSDESAQKLLERIKQERRRKWEEELRATGKEPRKCKYEEPQPVVTEGLPELPEGWSWSRVDGVAAVRLGRQRSPKNRPGKFARKYVRVANVFRDRLDLSDIKEMDFPRGEFERYHLRRGDLLLCEGQSPELVGRCAIWNEEIPDCCFQNTLIRVRCVLVNSRYMLYVFCHAADKGDFAVLATQGVNIAHLGATRLASYAIPIAPLNEQGRIVETIDGLFRQTEVTERNIHSGLQLQEQLEKAVVAKAFRGELVPQDPHDEPALILLERIRAQRESMGKKAAAEN